MEYTKEDFKEVAKQLMEMIQCDNGYHHFEGISFPSKWVNKIAKKAEIFFNKYPDMLTDEVLEQIGYGGSDENEDLMVLEGYSELDKVLGEYFDEGMCEGVVEIKPRLMNTYKRTKKKD